MTENDHPILKLFLVVALAIGNGAAIWEINALFGPYLTVVLWLLILAAIGIFDIWVFVKVFH